MCDKDMQNEYDTTDPKRVVAEGYDIVADEHAEWAQRTRRDERRRYTDVLLESLPTVEHLRQPNQPAGG